MKKLTLTVMVLVAFIVATSIVAQGKNRGDGPGFGRGPGGSGSFGFLIHLREELSLSDAQYEKLKVIAEKYAELRYENRDDRDKWRELGDAQRDEMDAVLTDEQKTKLKTLQSERRGRDGRKKGRGCDSDCPEPKDR